MKAEASKITGIKGIKKSKSIVRRFIYKVLQ